MVGDERLVGHVRDDELVLQPFGVGEDEGVPHALDAEALGPEVESLHGADAPDDRVDHPRTGAAGHGARILEKGQVGARGPLLVRVEEVVDGRVVLVDRLLHEAQAEGAGVEVDVPRRVARDARDVVDAVEAHDVDPFGRYLRAQILARRRTTTAPGCRPGGPTSGWRAGRARLAGSPSAPRPSSPRARRPSAGRAG